MTTATHLSFGIKTAQQRTTYEDILRIWQEADAIPEIEHAWLFDHFLSLGPDPTGPCLEGLTLLGALAARTERLRIGHVVIGNTYRHPAVLANMATTLDIISNGRLVLGLGAGWNEREHTMYGIPLYTTGERIRRLGEACEVIKLLWTEQEANYEGRYYHLKDALCNPKPVQKPHPPIMIGGSGEQLTLRVVARHADIWNYLGNEVEAFQRKNAILDEHCAAVGRDPATIQRSIQLRFELDDLEGYRNNLRSFINAGCTYIVMIPPASGAPTGTVRRVVEEVVKPLQDEFGR